MAEQQSPRQQKDHRARKHSCFLPLSRTANRRWGLKEGEGKKRKEKATRGGRKGRKDESVPTHFRIVPMHWAFSERTGRLQCFVWIHYCISVFPKLFNCCRVLRHDYPGFNADTIGESFFIFHHLPWRASFCFA